MMQWGNRKNILNANKSLGERNNESGQQKKEHKREKKLKLTLVWIRSNNFLRIKNLQNLQWNTQSNKNMSLRHRNIRNFCLIPCPHRPQMNRWKHCQMTHLIQVQSKNQRKQWRHLINHPHLQLNARLIMNKHPWKNLIRTSSLRNKKN